MSAPKFTRPPNFIVTKREGFTMLYATGVFGGLAPNDARMIFFADRLELEPGEAPGSQKLKVVNQEMQTEIHMSPATFKSVAIWMMKNLEQFEKTFGEIKAEPIKPGEGPKGYIK